MQVRLGLLNEDEVDPGRGRFGAERAIETDDLKQDEDKVADAEAGGRLHLCVTKELADHREVPRARARDVKECRKS